ncbi:MAG: hypothetical protein ACLU98_06300, partial [Desulfovibrio fairfieldensis]
WRQRSHTGIDSNDNHVFRPNVNFEICKISKLICSSPRDTKNPSGKIRRGSGISVGGAGMPPREQSMFEISELR